MIKPTRKTKLTTVCIFILSILICITCFTTACKPTPNETIVTRKDNAEAVIQKVAEQEKKVAPTEIIPEAINIPDEISKPNVYEVIQHVEDRYPVNGYEDFVFDADVYVPTTDKYPVAKITPLRFTQQQTDIIRDFFFKDSQFVNGNTNTKEYYEQMLINIKAEQANPDPNTGYLEGYFEQQIEWIEKQIKRAPENPEYEEISSFNIEGRGYNAKAIKDNIQIGYIDVNEHTIRILTDNCLQYTSKESLLDKLNNNEEQTRNNEEYIDATPFNMSKDKALNKCNELLEYLAIDYLKPSQITKQYFYDYSTRTTRQIKHGGYKIEYGQPLGSISPAKVCPFNLDADLSMYGYVPPVEAEYLSIVIDDSGNIVSFEWSYPSEFTETIAEHVDILSFNEILEKVKDFTRIKFGYNNETSSNKQGYIVSNIGLYAYYLPMKNNLKGCMYVPCWVFEYTYTESLEKGVDGSGSRFMMFNAIDGAPVSLVTTRELESLDN